MLLAAKLARWGDRLLTLAAALLLGALALFGAWSLWDIAATRRAALPEQTLRFKPLAAAPADSPGFAELRALNPDVCGWLTLDGTRIDFPVVQGADNMVYVNTDVYGDFSLSGAIFWTLAARRTSPRPTVSSTVTISRTAACSVTSCSLPKAITLPHTPRAR